MPISAPPDTSFPPIRFSFLPPSRSRKVGDQAFGAISHSKHKRMASVVGWTVWLSCFGKVGRVM